MNKTERRLYIPAAILLASFLGVPAANAQSSCQYTNASLQGNYAVVGNYTGGIALAFGVENFDGQGNLTRKAMVNAPTTGSTTGARTLTSTSSTGTYTVNCDGTGVYARVLTNLTTGVMTKSVSDFVITGAVTSFNGVLIATSIVDAQETPSIIVAGGVFVFYLHTRLPNQ